MARAVAAANAGSMKGVADIGHLCGTVANPSVWLGHEGRDRFETPRSSLSVTHAQADRTKVKSVSNQMVWGQIFVGALATRSGRS